MKVFIDIIFIDLKHFDVRIYAAACIYEFPYFLHLIIQPPGGIMCLGHELYNSVGYLSFLKFQRVLPLPFHL